ncbi:hypothetical protein NIES2101_18740 [Calothrix sp. HK-06]|nr:hypothetical protein NIES2101_18740 [Calothrix sp. HK-06]
MLQMYSQPNPEDRKAMFLIFTSLGCLSWMTAIIVSLFVLKFVDTALTADGEIIHRNNTGAHVKVRFTTADGNIIEYHQNSAVSYKVGHKVKVLYDPENPYNASTNAPGALWFKSTIISLIGTAFIIGAYGEWKQWQRIQRM